jgi:hypothetical protein
VWCGGGGARLRDGGGAIGGVLGLIVLFGVAWRVRASRASSPPANIRGHDPDASPHTRTSPPRDTLGPSPQQPLYEIASQTQSQLYDDANDYLEPAAVKPKSKRKNYDTIPDGHSASPDVLYEEVSSGSDGH